MGSERRGVLAPLVVLLAAWGVAFAQELPAPAREALGRAQRAASEALVAYDAHSPDRPLWTEALEAGREAARLAPEHPAPQRFLAQAYRQVSWYAQAWRAWQAYLAAGGAVDASVERQLLEVARYMGYAFYDRGEVAASVPYLETIVRFRPDDLGANVRLARYYLDRGEPGAAAPFVEATAGREPALTAQLERARLVERFGAAAVDAVDAGRQALDAGQPAVAVERLSVATEAAPDYAEAWAQLAPALERLGRTEAAAQAYRRVLALSGDVAEAHAGLGRIALAGNEPEEAVGRFEAAIAAAGDTARYRGDFERAQEALAAQEAEAAQQAAAEQAAEQAVAQAQAEAAERAQAAAEAESRARAEAEAAARAEEARVQGEARDAAAAETASETRASPAEPNEALDDPVLVLPEVGADPLDEDAPAPSETVTPGEPLVLVDATVVHRGGSEVASAGVAFLDAPALEVDLSGRDDDVLHLRVELLEAPDTEPLRYQLCLVPSDIAVSPACSPIDLLAFEGPGVASARLPWASLSGASRVDWRRGVDSVMVIARRADGSPLAADGSGDGDSDGGTDAGPALDAYLPMRVRVQAVAVPPGTTFPGWR